MLACGWIITTQRKQWDNHLILPLYWSYFNYVCISGTKYLQDNLEIISFLFMICYNNNIFPIFNKSTIIIYASIGNAPNKVCLIVRLLGETQPDGSASGRSTLPWLNIPASNLEYKVVYFLVIWLRFDGRHWIELQNIQISSCMLDKLFQMWLRNKYLGLNYLVYTHASFTNIFSKVRSWTNNYFPTCSMDLNFIPYLMCMWIFISAERRAPVFMPVILWVWLCVSGISEKKTKYRLILLHEIPTIGRTLHKEQSGAFWVMSRIIFFSFGILGVC